MWRAGASASAAAVLSVVVRADGPPAGQRGDAGPRYEPIAGTFQGGRPLSVRLMPGTPSGPAAPGQGGVAGDCVAQSFQYTSLNFEGMNQSVCVQAGFAENEIAAVEFALPAGDFPLVVRSSDFVFAQNHFNPTTTQWTWMVWDGPPNLNNLVASFSSDNVILPHITLPFMGSNAVNVQVVVDPGDPEQIIINNVSGTNSVTIGYRVDEHNNQPDSGCSPFPCGCNSGDIPASQNAFPTTDTTGVCGSGSPNFPVQNWLFAINCGPFGCPAGWKRFTQLGLCMPSGDWTMRVTYEPLGCSPGACCLPAGDCEIMTGLQCLQQSGAFQGGNTVCQGLECPAATGACCDIEFDMCAGGLTQSDCATQGNHWVGPQTSCSSTICDTEGACCFNDGSCVQLSGVFCFSFGGAFSGYGTSCSAPGFDCNPEGACCFFDGSCGDTLSPEECAEASGTYQGNDSTCSGVSCPQPTGACCASNGACNPLPQATCMQIPGATWGGPGTTCADQNGNGTPDGCEPPCPGDTNADGIVDVEDLVTVITTWGQPDGAGDVSGDGDVDVEDLVMVITGWGEC
jgi:hypothetical protein